MVKASEAVPRLAANSLCTTGSATTTDHMPTLPSEPISTATASRIHARRKSGMNMSEDRESSEEMTTAHAISGANRLTSSHIAAILGMQMEQD